jgi:Transposase and inactivated derivatives, IS1 family
LERLSRWEATVYCTDHWEAYAVELDVATKTDTVHIERNNSDNQRWLGRFQRRSKIVSKSLEMADLSMALFAKFRVNGSITLLRNWRLSLLT